MKPSRILRVGITRTAILWGLAGVALCGGIYEVLSETLTMSTFYPAPMGVYATILTTQQTLLARDSGSVGIGTKNPGQKLDVNGNMLLSANRAAIITTGDNATTHRGGFQFLTYDNGADTILTLTNQNGSPVNSNLRLGGFGAFNNNTVNLAVSGNMGVGKLPSAAALDVNGNINLSGELQLGSNATCAQATDLGKVAMIGSPATPNWCDGTKWQPLNGNPSGSVCSIDINPNCACVGPSPCACSGGSGSTCNISGGNPICPSNTILVKTYYPAQSCYYESTYPHYFNAICINMVNMASCQTGAAWVPWFATTYSRCCLGKNRWGCAAWGTCTNAPTPPGCPMTSYYGCTANPNLMNTTITSGTCQASNWSTVQCKVN